jgi:hypothetical protein
VPARSRILLAPRRGGVTGVPGSMPMIVPCAERRHAGLTVGDVAPAPADRADDRNGGAGICTSGLRRQQRTEGQCCGSCEDETSFLHECSPLAQNGTFQQRQNPLELARKSMVCARFTTAGTAHSPGNPVVSCCKTAISAVLGQFGIRYPGAHLRRAIRCSPVSPGQQVNRLCNRIDSAWDRQAGGA